MHSTPCKIQGRRRLLCLLSQRETVVSRFDPKTASRWQKLLRHRSTPLLFILTCVLAFLAVHAGWICVSGKPTRDVLVILGTMEVGVYWWVRAYAGLQLWRQIQVLCLFVSLQAALHLMVRLDGFTGDARPIWTWRWAKTPQERFAESHLERPKEEKSKIIDLASTTPWDSPGFRGQDRSGRMAAGELETDWRAHPPQLLWRHPMGGGWSTFALVGDFCVTQEQRQEDEAVVCYEVRTGREVWEHRNRAHFYEVTGDEGPRATPTIHRGRVYTLGATGILNCLEGSSGHSVWSVNILEESGTPNRLFGMAGSPLVVEVVAPEKKTLVIVSPGGKGNALAAYDAENGKRAWHGGDADASYSSPHLTEIAGRRQVLSFNADGLFAHDLADGSVLGSVPWVSNPAERNNVCQPVLWSSQGNGDVDSIFISSGYNMGSSLFRITRIGHDEEADPFLLDEIWRNRFLKAKFSSVVLHEGYLYGLDGAALACLDIATGERKWKAGHYGYGQLVLAGSHLLVQLESGEIALIAASPERHRELTRFAALSSRTWNHPILAGNLLLVRNDREAACYELPLK
jgi:outer membrane protein assembly factor BamB